MTLLRRHWLLCFALVLAASAAVAWFLLPGFSYGLLSTVERLRSGLYVMETEVEGAPIAYLEGGDGEVVVLLHGFAANKDHWTRISRYLTPHVRVIAPDLPTWCCRPPGICIRTRRWLSSPALRQSRSSPGRSGLPGFIWGAARPVAISPAPTRHFTPRR